MAYDKLVPSLKCAKHWFVSNHLECVKGTNIGALATAINAID